jgi:nitroreductase
MTPDQLQTAMEAASRAPSLHNTQPWHFSLDGDGALLVHADRRRQLAAQDADGRELAISCGAAAAHARTALRGEGHGVRLTIRPDPYDLDLLARIQVTGASWPSPEEQRRADALLLRRTDRTAFADDPLPQTLVEQICTAAEQDGAWVRVLDGDDAVELAVLLSAADAAQRLDASVQEDLRRWTRDGPLSTDGVPSDQHDRLGSPVVLRDFGPHRETLQPVEDPPHAERPVLLVIGTDGDTAADWVRAGVAMSDLWLAATARGIVASPLSQVIEVPATRARLGNALHVLGRPQVVLRAGWPQGLGSPATGRLRPHLVDRPSAC